MFKTGLLNRHFSSAKLLIHESSIVRFRKAVPDVVWNLQRRTTGAFEMLGFRFCTGLGLCLQFCVA